MAVPHETPFPDQKLCTKCKTATSSVKARGDLMCQDCFFRYVRSKVGKRMEPYKVRTNKPASKILFALSLGVSSLTLLHILSQQLQGQMEKIGRCGYELYICIMNDTSVFTSDAGRDEEDKERVKRVSELFFNDRKEWPMMKEIVIKSTEGSFNAISTNNSEYRELLDACRVDGVDGPKPEQPVSYNKFITSLPSASARSDMNTVLTRRFIIRQGQELGCDTIVWGDSTTRLAERTLAETAKGRGFSLPWQTADGPTPFDINFLFPMRDLLRKEIVSYAKLMQSLASLAKPEYAIGVPQASSKDATIDALMTQYFGSVEENFPSIVTNVVRTSNRLQPPSYGQETANRRCRICALPVVDGADGLYGWAGSQEDDVTQPVEGIYCYGCARSTKGRKA